MEVEDKIAKQYDTDHKGHALRVLQKSVQPLQTCISTASSGMCQYSLFRYVSVQPLQTCISTASSGMCQYSLFRHVSVQPLQTCIGTASSDMCPFTQTRCSPSRRKPLSHNTRSGLT